MNQEEIQKRIEAAQERHKERMAPVLERKAKDKEIAEKLSADGIVLAYMNVRYAQHSPCLDAPIGSSTKVSIAAKETITDGKSEIDIVYTILSKSDKFVKAIAREILAARLQDANAKQRIKLVVPKKAVDDSEKMYKVLKKAMNLELATNIEAVPAWLYKGIQSLEEIYGSDEDLF